MVFLLVSSECEAGIVHDLGQIFNLIVSLLFWRDRSGCQLPGYIIFVLPFYALVPFKAARQAGHIPLQKRCIMVIMSSARLFGVSALLLCYEPLPARKRLNR
jgi:hypothetical protein